MLFQLFGVFSILLNRLSMQKDLLTSRNTDTIFGAIIRVSSGG